jgi:hypothetical protein
VVRYYALAENVRHAGKGHVEARVARSFGRSDRLDKAVLERLVSSIRRVLAEESGTSVVDGAIDGTGAGGIEIEDIFELGVVHVARALWVSFGTNSGSVWRLPPGLMPRS